MSRNKHSFWIFFSTWSLFFFFLAVQQTQSIACKCFELGVAVRGGHISAGKCHSAPVRELWMQPGSYGTRQRDGRPRPVLRVGGARCSMWGRAERVWGKAGIREKPEAWEGEDCVKKLEKTLLCLGGGWMVAGWGQGE